MRPLCVRSPAAMPMRGGLAAALVQRVSAGEAGVLKRAVALVEVQVVRGGVVGDQEVGLAIAVDVDEQRRKPVVVVGVAQRRRAR